MPVFRGLAVLLVVLHGSTGSAFAQQPTPLRDAAAKASFQQTAPRRANDSGREGAAIGALVGGGIMATFFIVSSKQCGPGCDNDLPGWLPAFGTGIGVAAGATAGYFIDKAIRGQRVAVGPTLTKRERGVKVAFRF